MSDVRLHEVDSSRLEALMQKKGWDEAKLAVEADIDLVTIKRIMKGKKVLKSTLRSIAACFDVGYEQLKADGPPLPAEEMVITISVKIGGAVPPGQELQTLALVFLQKLIESAGVQNAIEVRAARVGSIILELEMTTDDAVRVYRAWLFGKLDELQITEVRLPEGALAELMPLVWSAALEESARPIKPRPNMSVGCMMIFMAIIIFGGVLARIILDRKAPPALKHESMLEDDAK